MKKMQMKGKTVDEAVSAALEVLSGKKEDARVKVLSEGKSGMLGIGGEEAEVEVVLREGVLADSKQALQDILDKMSFLAMVEGKEVEGGAELNIKGEDLGRIIGKEGATLRALEILVSRIVGRLYDERIRVNVDAGDYKAKRDSALERLAKDAADEVAKTGQQKVLPQLDARDRRVVHMFLQEKPEVTTFSEGEGKERRLVIAPR